jgi:hypothetical protein
VIEQEKKEVDTETLETLRTNLIKINTLRKLLNRFQLKLKSLLKVFPKNLQNLKSLRS